MLIDLFVWLNEWYNTWHVSTTDMCTKNRQKRGLNTALINFLLTSLSYYKFPASKALLGYISNKQHGFETVTRWNGDKWHKDGLNMDKDMAYSLKCKITVFEIQTMDIHTPQPPTPPPPQTSVSRKTTTSNRHYQICHHHIMQLRQLWAAPDIFRQCWFYH